MLVARDTVAASPFLLPLLGCWTNLVTQGHLLGGVYGEGVQVWGIEAEVSSAEYGPVCWL